MNANYIYDIFETREKLDLPGLTLALAHHQNDNPIPEGMTDSGIRKFIGGHDREAFAAAVDAGVKEDEERKAALEAGQEV